MDKSCDYMHELEAHGLFALVVHGLVVANVAVIVADDNGIALVDNSIHFDCEHFPKIKFKWL